MCNFFCNIAEKNKLESDVARFITHVQTFLVTNQVAASCVNTDFWLDKITRESGHIWQELYHLLQKKFTWAGKTRGIYRC